MADLQKQRIDPRLCALAQEIGRALGLTDPIERDATLQDIQVLFDRCGYHIQLALARRAWRNWRLVRRERAIRPGARSRGRPRGAANFAARQFGLGLAMIWWEHTGRRPSRHEPERLRVRRGYPEFVRLVVLALPPSSRRMPRGAPPEIDYLVRVSVKDFRAALQSPEEYRRRGLIDEWHWLDKPVPA